MDPATLVVVLLISGAIMRGGGAARADSRNYRDTALADLRRDQPGHSDRWYRRHTWWRWLGRMGHEVREGLPTLRGHVTEDVAYARLGYAQARAGHHNRLRDLRRLIAEASEAADKAREAVEREGAERDAARAVPPAGRHAAGSAPVSDASPASTGGPASPPPVPSSERDEKASPATADQSSPPAAGGTADAPGDPAVPVAPVLPPAGTRPAGNSPDVFDEAPRDAIDELTDTVPVDAPPAPPADADPGSGAGDTEQAPADPRSAQAGVVDPFGEPGARGIPASDVRTMSDLRDWAAGRSAIAADLAEQMEDAQTVVATKAAMQDPAIAGPITTATAEARAISDCLAQALTAARSHAAGEEYVAGKGAAAAATEFLASDAR